jgi:Ser/Thr protein kinase RdoA (MazF antagonist)
MQVPLEPGAIVLQHFGAQLLAPLGGRLNWHWLVERRGQRLVLRRWSPAADDIAYELRLVDRLAALSWPVARVLDGPVDLDGHIWSLAPFLPGEPPAAHGPRAEQRARGRLLAELHADLATLGELGQRGAWRRGEAILADETLDHLLGEHEPSRPEEVRILRWHLERARARVAELRLDLRPGQVVHGDFAPWNLRYLDGRLSGLLDFELAHWDHRVGDFALAWRGKYDDVILGYAEVAPLDAEEWQLITPLWWALLIEGACHDLRRGTRDDGWTIRKLLQRSPLMGPDAAEYR